MCLKKIAVAGVVVVGGIVGIVNAQSPVSDALGASAQSGTMEASYEVQSIADLTVVPKGLTGNDLLNVKDAATAQTFYGNLGTVVVTTNYPAWDVTVTAQNDLKLMSGSEPPTQTCDEWGQCTSVPGTGSTGVALKGTGSTEAELVVFVGVRKEDQTAWLLSGGFADLTAAIKSASGDASFATVIGTALTATGTYNGQKGTEAGSGIVEKGFITPNPDNVATPGGTVTFYVSVGFDPTTIGASGKVDGVNDNGIYSEYLTFTMVAGSF